MANQILKGSERKPLPGAQALGPALPNERLEVTILLRRRDAATLQARAHALLRGERPAPLSRADFARQHGHDPADVVLLQHFLLQHGLVMVEENAARRSVVVSGTVAQFSAAFDVTLQRFEHPGGSYRGRVGAIHVPDELLPAIEGVFGLDNRMQAAPHFRIKRVPGNVRWHRPATVPDVSYTPPQVAALYGFPAATGAGQTIALIELGGGYRTADLASYFTSLGLPAPNVTSISVDQGANRASGDPNGPDGEVMLDIEVAASVASGAAIVVYFTPNTDAGFIDAVSTAVHDTTHAPSVVSISWGGPESSWTAQAMTALSQVIEEAATLGVTVCIASGDGGSSDGVTDDASHVDFPASSPYALGCGGTNLQHQNSVIKSETVWNDGANGAAGGGGVSTFFALPSWQSGLAVTATGGARSTLTMRGVPDVCGDADPDSGYNVRVDGQNTVIGGTSAVAPLWAALIAKINSVAKSPVGFINPLLYKNPAALNDIVSGNNGAFAASVGWDACSGLGSPKGENLVTLLTK